MTQLEQIPNKVKLVEPVSMVVNLTSLTEPYMRVGLHVDLQPGMVLDLSTMPVRGGNWQAFLPITAVRTPSAEPVHIHSPIPLDCAYPLDPQGQMVIGCHCKGCRRWNDWNLGDLATHCEDATTPEPWYSAAMGGGLPGCPHHTTPPDISGNVT